MLKKYMEKQLQKYSKNKKNFLSVIFITSKRTEMFHFHEAEKI